MFEQPKMMTQSSSAQGLLEGLVRWRAASAAMVSAAIAGGSMLMVSFFLIDGLHIASVAAGAAILGPAQLLRAAASLRRSPSLPSCGLGVRGLVFGIAAILMTALSQILLSLGFGADGLANESKVLGCLLGLVCQLKLMERQGLVWVSFPRQAAHRRVKSRIVPLVTHALVTAVVCTVIAALLNGGNGIFSLAAVAEVFAAIAVLLSADLHIELLQDCTAFHVGCSWGIGGGIPRADELVEALMQPLACEGPGLGRWAALATLSQAVAYRHQGHREEPAPAFTDISKQGGVSTASRPPHFASEVFSSGASWNIFESADAMKAQVASGRRSFFSIYLTSGLEVLREFTVRMQCLVAASYRRGPKALQPMQLAAIEASIVELLPLLRISASGLSGWICLSRDFDESGSVQREEALRKVIYELCGVLSAIEGVGPLCGILDLSPECCKAAQSAQEEARHSLYQLLVTFEDFGLKQVVLPPLYRQLVEKLCQ
eukprot:TRINITY_DN19682_c0_g1_i1.p1 TRINITY_DN19682_c0_g1~~TRINITY_DN19682_c0_g1_i1.p1  ORF type:complete len:488 (-),score=90.01 TRINITY_DN19682_c0_g1_i1:149-1612(-)